MADDYKHLDKHKKLHEKAIRMIDTTNHEHRVAYNKGVEEVLKDKDGHIDYEKLDEAKNQLKLADIMSKHYISKAKKSLGVTKHKDDALHNALLMKAYAGVTKDQLIQNIGKYGKNFKYEIFDKVREGVMKEITQTLLSAVGSHLNDKHIGDIIKYTGADKIKEFNPDYLDRESALEMLSNYHMKKEKLTRSDIERMIDQQGLSQRLLKKKKKSK